MTQLTIFLLVLIQNQEVIGALVTHIGSGFGLEIDAAFTVAKSLSEEITKKVVPFTIFFKVLNFYGLLSIFYV